MILQLFLILLLVGVAEAQQDIYTDCLHKAPDSTTYDICRMPDLRQILSESKPCEQKMKEAMRDADTYPGMLSPALFFIDGAYGIDIVEDPISCGEICRLEKQLAAAKARQKEHDTIATAKKKWDAVMKECVQ